jgi:hypothetical protein
MLGARRDGELWGGRILVFRHVVYTNLGNGIFNTQSSLRSPLVDAQSLPWSWQKLHSLFTFSSLRTS